MQKLHGETSETGTASDVERMPRPPARPEPIAPHRSAAPPSAGPTGHPFYAHHDRVSAAHTEFLRNQERVHLEFLAHRKRLLEWLDEAGRQVETASAEHEAPLPEWSPPITVAALAAMPAVVPPPPTTPTAKPERMTVTVGWSDALLDSHVAPLAVVFSGLTRVVGEGTLGVTDAHFGVLDFEFRGLGQLAVPGESITSDLVVSPQCVAGAAEIRFIFRRRSRELDMAISRWSKSEASARLTPRRRSRTLVVPRRARPSTRTFRARGPRSASSTSVKSRRLYEGEIFSTFGAGFERAGSRHADATASRWRSPSAHERERL